MGNKIITIVILLSVLCNSCQKTESDQGRPHHYLADESRLWFNQAVSEVRFYKSNSGLSERYSIQVTTESPLTTINNVQTLAETNVILMTPSLSNLSFYFRISNLYAPDYIELQYVDYNADYFMVTQRYYVHNTNQNIWFDPQPPYKQARCLGFNYIGDTIINKIRYKDIYVNKIEFMIEEPHQGVREMYLSKALGLIAYKTDSTTIWYKE